LKNFFIFFEKIFSGAVGVFSLLFLFIKDNTFCVEMGGGSFWDF
jgi:hypothetical protein